MQVAAAARVGGMLFGKCGVVNVHIGSGKSMIDYLFRAAETEIPLSQFVPTHTNRNQELFAEAQKYAKIGGFIDFTTSTTQQSLIDGEVKCSKALKICLDGGIPVERISFTSDGQGSMPMFSEAGEHAGMTIARVTSVFSEFSDSVHEGVPMEDAVRVVFTTTDDRFKLQHKGHIKEDYDADILLFDKGFNIKYVFA